MKYTLDWETIRRKCSGTLLPGEEKELEAWTREDRNREKLVEAAGQYYRREDLPVIGKERIDRAWARFDRDRRRRSLFRQLGRWSVAAVVLIALGAGVWAIVHPVGTEDPENRIAAILPGESKALLILSDGKRIELKGQDERQWTDQTASIRIDSTGIRYEAPDSVPAVLPNILRIPQGGEFQLVLSDGTRVWLNSKTELTYPVAFPANERRVKLNGEAYFEVARNEHQPFIVETDAMEVEVLGTSFNVNAYPDEQHVVTTLVEGKVRLQQENGEMLRTLLPSEQALWDRSEENLTVRKVNTFTYTQWRNGRFVFRDNTLEEIMRSLARWYDMSYEFRQPELKNERFYGVIDKYGEIKQLLDQFEKTGKVHFTYEEHKISIKK